MLDFVMQQAAFLNFNLLEHSIPECKWTNFCGKTNAAIQMLQEKHHQHLTVILRFFLPD